MDLFLPPDNGDQARSTSDFGRSRRIGSSPHGGFDANRGRGVQPHGRVTSPVYGVIKEIKPGLGRIVIEERDPVTGKPTGYDVEILHTQTQTVKPRDPVEPKQQIGTQGDAGAQPGAYHAHIQVYRGDRTPLNPLRHLFEYHHPGELILALPQFEPRQLPPRTQRGAASQPGNQDPSPGGVANAAPDPFRQGGKPTPYLAQTQALDPAFGTTNWLQRPTSPNVSEPNAAPPFAPSARTRWVNPVPYLDRTRPAQTSRDAPPMASGTEPGSYNQPSPFDSAEWPLGPVGAPGTSVNANDAVSRGFSELENSKWYRPSYLPPSDAAGRAAPLPPAGSLLASPLSTPDITLGVGRVGPVVAPPIPFIAAVPPSAPGGIPGLLMQTGAFDSSYPGQPPAGGLLGLLLKYARNDDRDQSATRLA